MSVTDEQIKYVLAHFPDSGGDNTEICLRFWEMACKAKGIVFPEEIKNIIRTYKPEAITRKRREHTKPTSAQLNKQEEFQNYYSL